MAIPQGRRRTTDGLAGELTSLDGTSPMSRPQPLGGHRAQMPSIYIRMPNPPLNRKSSSSHLVSSTLTPIYLGILLNCVGTPLRLSILDSIFLSQPWVSLARRTRKSLPLLLLKSAAHQSTTVLSLEHRPSLLVNPSFPSLWSLRSSSAGGKQTSSIFLSFQTTN